MTAEQAGNYTIKLLLEDPEGLSSTYLVEFNVKAPGQESDDQNIEATESSLAESSQEAQGQNS